MQQEKPLNVAIVQQGVWDMPLESMPLAAGYLKAMAMADDDIRARADIKIHNFRGGVSHSIIADTLFSEGAPDVLAFSVLGWNYRAFGSLAATIKQLKPGSWVVFGGTHVAGQAERVFRMFSDVDVVVNGEGELTFRDLLRARLAGVSRNDLSCVQGVSYQGADGRARTTEDRKRIDDLDIIPSPALTGAIDLTDDQGRFRYDVALMETNRGCPYKCAFCYWGGAVGQRVRAFSRERLRAELELFGKMKVHTIVACDANFGLLGSDKEFVTDLIEIRDLYGFPRALETSWAKNKSKNFFEIVSMMKEAGMRSSFTIALQTLSDEALGTMNRRNMKVNEWEDLAVWLDQQGLDVYAELIWGAPGETVGSFMRGYDKLARRVSRIATYPMLLLPNTDYMEKKAEYGIVSVRGETDDFEYVLAHNTMTFADNRQMRRFLFWARVVAENAVLRHSWIAARELAGITQSQVLTNLDEWISKTDDPAAAPLREAQAKAIGGTAEIGGAITYFYTQPEARRMLGRWWQESVVPLAPADAEAVLCEVFRYDLLTQPAYETQDGQSAEDLPTIQIRGEDYYLRAGVQLNYDVPRIIQALRKNEQPDLKPAPLVLDLYYKTGSGSAVTSTNHEVIVHFMGMTKESVLAKAAMRDDSLPEPEDAAASIIGDRGGCG